MVLESQASSIYELKEMNLNKIIKNYTNNRNEFNKKVKNLKEKKKKN